jgi:integrase
MVATQRNRGPVLTKTFCETAPVGRHYDAKLPGFGLYVGKSGARAFFVEYRPGHGRSVAKRRMSLGAFGLLTAEEGRRLAKQRLGEVATGGDPLAKRQADKRSVEQRFEVVVEEWLARDQRKNRTCSEVERLMRRDVIPTFQGRPIDQIRKRDIVQLLDGIGDRGSPVMANRTLVSIRRLFRWATERDRVDADPTAGIGKPNAERTRDRVLTDDEIAAIWRASEAMAGPYGIGIRLLVLTGARREEIFGAGWDEYDPDGATVELPAARSKVKQQRSIMLTAGAVHLVESLPRVGPYMLTTNGVSPFSGFSKAKVALDRESGIGDWRVHDIRRTVATGLQRLGVRLEVTETVLGHVAGSRRGVIGIYQRHSFRDEARAALTAWEQHLQRLLKRVEDRDKQVAAA